MATADPGSPISQRHAPVSEPDPYSDSASSRSDSDASQASDAACPWRTSRYWDQECSRYFDCPTHTLERAPSELGRQDGPQGEATQERADAPERPGRRGEPGSVSPLGEGQSDDDNDGPSRVPPSPLRLDAEEGRGAPDPSGLAASEPVVPGPPARRASSDRPGSSADSSPPFQPPTHPRHARPETGGMPPTAAAAEPRAAEPRASNASVSGPSPATRLVSRPAAALPSPTPPAPPSPIVLPRWQPDSEATYCPICGTQFSIFVRKHHCRKCGRVVCNSCSPHRITIPHQYIVRPPGAPRPVAQSSSLSLLDSQGWYPEFGGGERVRLCNPCVPDPNTAPPQAPGSQARSATSPRIAAQTEERPLSSIWNLYFGSGAASDAQTRSRSATMHPGMPSSSRPRPPPPRSNESRVLWGTPPAYYRPTASNQPPHVYPGYRPYLDLNDRAGPSSAAAAGPSAASSSSSTHRLYHAAPSRPQIPEEDECPVCHRELPPRTLPNFEALRESHIASCIASHSRYGGPSRTGAQDGDDADPLGPVLPRRTGMFPYRATEKDCVDSAECSICLEEFEVGVAMARLECLCRFHRACIDAWWERHPGRCPMHQHDGFGY
ncbi:hypothetical protein VTJ83DRAFT_481 [Remersonia thermophila]|uniref:Uncharacterized protein n=1 Tax=Remersonia thermophila TaxID=72144 RepID=A0ABR4DLS5_9PEZI